MTAPGFPPDRWVRFVIVSEDDDDRITVLALPTETGGRVVVKTLVIDADHVDSAVIRAIPMGQFEQQLNVPEIRRAIESGAPNTELTRHLEKSLATSDPLPDVGAEEPRPKLGRPTGQNPDAFYRLVAQAHTEAVAAKRPPAPVLAEEAGVPVRTVHGWVREARRRGFLPPTSQGRT